MTCLSQALWSNLTDLWTPALARYRARPAVVIDTEVLGYPRSISREENGSSVSEKYDCIYTVALMPDGGAPSFAREQVPVIQVNSLDVAGILPGEQDSAKFAAWCAGEFCGAEPAAISSPHTTGTGRFIGAAVLPHTIPMYEARHRPSDHRNRSLEAIEQVRRHLEQWQPDVIVLASTHWMPRDGFFIDDGAQHEDGCDTSYQGVEPQLFSFPGDPELAALVGALAQGAGLPVKRIHRVAQEHAVWVPGHLLCQERRIPLLPCSIWWRGPREAHRRFGEIIGEAVRQLGRSAFSLRGSSLHAARGLG